MNEKMQREIVLKSEKGEIDVFICPTDEPGAVDSPAVIAGDPLLENFEPVLSPFQRVDKTSSPRREYCFVWPLLIVGRTSRRFAWCVIYI